MGGAKLHAHHVAELVRRGDLSAYEHVCQILEKIERIEDKVRAYITLIPDIALEKAKEVDRKVEKGKRLGKLAGVVLAIKDVISTKGIPTTCGSLMLQDYIPPYDATAVERAVAEDAIIIGKTNMDEFAMGSTTENSAFGPTFNPWDLSRVPGGSSGGSAAALAAGEADISLGSDTGGSVRCPASFCGVVGLKPTYGLVSRYGLIAYANSLEQIGPLTLCVRDCALLMEVVSGHDPRDSTSIPTEPKKYQDVLEKGVEGLRIGVPEEMIGEGVDPLVAKEVWRAVDTLSELGAVCEETSLPSLEYSLAAYYVIAMSEASSNLARYDGVRYGFRAPDEGMDWSSAYSKTRRLGFGPEVRRRILLGTYALSAGYFDKYYLKAMKVRTLIKRDFDEAFKRFDVLASPTMPILPPKIGEKVADPLSMYMCDIDTVPANLAGIPSISVPCGLVDGLPVGFQAMAPPLGEELLLRVGYALESQVRLYERIPVV